LQIAALPLLIPEEVTMRTPWLVALAVSMLAAGSARAQGYPAEKIPDPPTSPRSNDAYEGKSAAGERIADQVADAIEDFIKEDSKLKGGPFLVYDPVDKVPLQLELVKVHADRIGSVGDGAYYACTDMRDPDEIEYDLDFFMKKTDEGFKATEVAVHKKSGQPRYGWKEDHGTWKKVKG
jgi:hypothetical protein